MPQRTTLEIPFPKLGLIESSALREQPAESCIDVQNMRVFSPLSGRARGAQRAGLGKWCSAQIGGASGRIQCLNHVTTIVTNTVAQTAMNVRTVTPVAVQAGKIRTFNATQSLSPTGVSDPDLLATAPFIQSAVFAQKVYFCDGANYRKYDPSTGSNGTVSAWTAATAGTIPANGADVCRLIVGWNNRLVMSGIESDPQNIFFSAWGDAENWDYAPADPVSTQAVALGTTEGLSKLPEPVMSLMPSHNQDLLYVGGDHSIYVIAGDPMLGGTVERVSNITGTAFGSAWCNTPRGNLYFFGSRGGVYRMAPGAVPERITANRIEKRLQNIDLDAHFVQLVWDDEEIGVRVVVFSLTGNVTDCFFYCERSDSWMRDVYDDANHIPAAIHVYDGDDPEDRVIWYGGQDGYVRYHSPAFYDDDGTVIDSYVVLGPIQIEGGNMPFIVSDLQALLASGSDPVAWELAIADDAAAVEFNSGGYWLRESGGRWMLEDGSGFWLLEGSSTTNPTGTFTATRSYVANPRRRGYTAYVRLRNSTAGQRWEMEYLRAALSASPTSKRRF